MNNQTNYAALYEGLCNGTISRRASVAEDEHVARWLARKEERRLTLKVSALIAVNTFGAFAIGWLGRGWHG